MISKKKKTDEKPEPFRNKLGIAEMPDRKDIPEGFTPVTRDTPKQRSATRIAKRKKVTMTEKQTKKEKAFLKKQKADEKKQQAYMKKIEEYQAKMLKGFQDTIKRLKKDLTEIGKDPQSGGLDNEGKEQSPPIYDLTLEQQFLKVQTEIHIETLELDMKRYYNGK